MGPWPRYNQEGPFGREDVIRKPEAIRRIRLAWPDPPRVEEPQWYSWRTSDQVEKPPPGQWEDILQYLWLWDGKEGGNEEDEEGRVQ
eukprot:1178348-Prorocentrum_minimum.AAC.5